MDAWSVFTDIGFICLLLLVGTFLRAKVKFIQALFLPASLIAGVLGLVLGPHGLGIIPFSEALSSYSGILIAVVFAALPFTSRLDGVMKELKHVTTTWAVSQSIVLLQWGVGLLFSLAVIATLFSSMHIPDGFGLMLAAGFMGGHGTAAALAEVFSDQWPEAQSLGMTAATLGIIISIVGGILLIKYESQRGGTTYLRSFKDLPEELRTGIIPRQRQESVGRGTVSSMSVDPLIFHAGLIIGVAGVSYLIATWLTEISGGLSIPTFSVAFLLGFAVLGLLRVTKAWQHFDQRLFERTSGSATDLLVVAGIASIDPAIVMDYAAPLFLLLAFGTLFILSFYFFVAKRLFAHHKVEQSIFMWGWNTGTVAMGIALLRIVDPEMRSKTLDYYGVAYVPIGFVDIATIAVLPVLVMAGFAWPTALVLVLLGVAILVLARIFLVKKAPEASAGESVSVASRD